MRRYRWSIAAGVAAAAVLAASSASVAQTVEERLQTLEKTVAEQGKTLTEKLGIEIHGALSTEANYNFNSPDDNTNAIHIFDVDADTIVLYQGLINIQRNVPEGFGFNLDIDFGKVAEVVGNATWWSNNLNSTESNNSVELVQGYVKYTLGGTPFSIMGGKFVTPHGEEVIPTYNNQNYNISNSINFGYSIPFTHTGFVGAYALPDNWGSFSLAFINGWDDVVDNNDGKSVQGALSLTPPESMFSFALATTYGPEQQDNGRSKRFLVTPLVTVKPLDEWTFVVEGNYGNESNVQLVNGSLEATPSTPGNAAWYGVAGYAVWAPAERWQFALRSEYFGDPDGVRTLYQQPGGDGPGVGFWEITLTPAYKVMDGLWLRGEYRHDEADKKYFENGGNPVKGQDIIETQLVYTF
jgi:opacity protein-like surface antigen